MEEHSVSRLLGAPPGYVGYEEGGQLTEAVRRKPFSVVLFDEIEKAHQDVFNALLQLLDDGRLTDAQGRTVDFKNTVVIMTSNVGSHFLMEGMAEAGRQPSSGEISFQTKERVLGELRLQFRPEFLNRVDDIVLFKTLTLDEVGEIVELMTDELANRLRDRRIRLEVTRSALGHIARAGYDPVYGARPLKRFIQHELESRLGRALIAGEIADGARVTVDVEGGQLVIRPENQGHTEERTETAA